MDARLIQATLANSLSFLEGRASFLYGSKNVRFVVADHYTDFDEMLKREIVYSKIEVLERVCECRIMISGNTFEVRLETWLANDETSKKENILDIGRFIQLRYHEPSSNSGNISVRLYGYEGGAELHNLGTHIWSLRSSGPWKSLPVSGNAEPSSFGQELAAWTRNMITIWAAQVPNLRLVEQVAPIEAATRTLEICRPFSQIDFDSSSEEPPSVFRWQEANLFSKASFSPISEPDFLKILSDNGTATPVNGRLMGIQKSEIKENVNCATARYAHWPPDTDHQSDVTGITEGLLRHPGFIAVEGDFWEFHVDVPKNLVIGEYRKWRDL